MSPFLEEQITALLEDSRWDIAYLGMQIVIESLALAAFGDMLRAHRGAAAQEAAPLRHGRRGPPRRLRRAQPGRVLPASLTEAELKDRQEFLRREHAAQPGPGHHARDLGAAWASTLEAVLPCDDRGGRGGSRSTRFDGFASGLLRQARAQRPQARPARRQRRLPPPAVGRGRPAASSSSPTTPARTTRPTTPSPRTAPRPPRPTDAPSAVDRLGRSGRSAVVVRSAQRRVAPFARHPVAPVHLDADETVSRRWRRR